MRLLLVALLAGLPMSRASAGLVSAPQPSDRQKLARWIADEDLRGGTMLDLGGDLQGVLYARGLSVGQRCINDSCKGSQPYVDFDPGGIFQAHAKPQPLLLIMLHPLSISEAIWRHLPFRERLKLWKLPDVEIGPAVKLPLPAVKWTLRDSVGVVVALGF